MSKKRVLPNVLNDTEVEKLISYCNNSNSFYMKRMKVFFMLILSTGLRLNEATSLKYEHINFDTKMLKVIQGKNSKDRNLFINSQCEQVLKEWHQYQCTVCKQEPIYVFTTMYGGEHSWDNDNCRGKVYEISEKAIGRRIHPHLLRHTFRHKLIEEWQ